MNIFFELSFSRILKGNALCRKLFSFSVMINEAYESFPISLPHHNRLFTLIWVYKQNLEKMVEARLHFTVDVVPAQLFYLLLKLSGFFSAA